MSTVSPLGGVSVKVARRNRGLEQVDRPQRIVAVGLLTEQDLSMLGEGFRRIYRLDEHHDFAELLARIDEAERSYRTYAE